MFSLEFEVVLTKSMLTCRQDLLRIFGGISASLSYAELFNFASVQLFASGVAVECEMTELTGCLKKSKAI